MRQEGRNIVRIDTILLRVLFSVYTLEYMTLISGRSVRFALLFLLLALSSWTKTPFCSIKGVRAAEDVDVENVEIVEEDEVADVDEDEDEDEDFEEEILEPHTDADVAFDFVNFRDMRFPLKESVDLLISFHHKGASKDSLNITSIHGSLHAPWDYEYMVQNFTEIYHAMVVSASEEMSLHYPFLPNPNFEPRQFDLCVCVYYADEEGNEFRSVVFNSTIEIVDALDRMELRTFFLYCLAISAVGLVGYFAFKTTRGMKSSRGAKGKGKRYSPGSPGSPASDVDLDDWVKDHIPKELDSKYRKAKKK